MENSHKFSKVEFIWNGFELNKTFLIYINKYFEWSKKFSQVLIVNDKNFWNVFHLNFHNNQGVFKFLKIFINVY